MNDKRCVGKYGKSKGLKGVLKREKNERLLKPWKKRWHFINFKCDKLCRKSPFDDSFIKSSVLLRNGRERIRLDANRCGQRSLITNRFRFHKDKHWVDFYVDVSDFGNESYEFQISCYLDGWNCIDLVNANWVRCVKEMDAWRCLDCVEGGSKDHFASKKELLQDHIKPVIKGISYLCSHHQVNVFLHNLNDIGASAVRLDCAPPKSDKWFLVNIGKVKMGELSQGSDEASRWIYQQLEDHLKLKTLQ